MPDADIAFVGGKVFTAVATRSFVDSVSIGDGRIMGVGDVTETIGARTRVVDLAGGLLTPGFIDAHVHPTTSGLDRLRINFDGCDSAEEAIAVVSRYATGHHEIEWIVGSGWSQVWFERGCPSAAALDAVVPDRPVVITNTDGHGAWVNSEALRRGGVTRFTNDPTDGRIERLPDGSPQGTLHEGAVHLVERHAPADTADDYYNGLLRGQEELFRYGITGWQEASVVPAVQEAYIRASSSGRLLGDAVGALWWERGRGLEQVEELRERREQSAPGFRPTSVKLMLDGVAENFTASVLDPYLDGSGVETDNRGVDFIDPGELREIVTILDRHGFQCHFHSLGDRAVRSALDAIESALRANGPSGSRHHLAHLQFVHPDDVPRFSALGAIANAQPFWACNDDYQIELTRPFISPERDRWQYPFRSLVDSGARLGMGSDWAVSTANVMREIEVATTRTCGGGEPLGADQTLTAVEALTAFTLGSAYINHSEREQGSIELGKKGNLAVFDRDPFAEGSFGEAEVVMTVVGGTPVYER